MLRYGSGPYYSPFLLNVLLAHACRHARPDHARFAHYDSGEHFLGRAEKLLVEELQQDGPQIPTIQGLLVLRGRQCAVGKNSQGWLFTGMAITMLKDVGPHLLKVREALVDILEPEDIEVRKRIFLSAYAWDKSMSLTFGRPPSLPQMPYNPLHILMDDSEDHEDWVPWYLGGTVSQYPRTRAHIASTFSYFCELMRQIV
ncbi:putative Nitrogen assimilation transcription factor nirA [Seiridium cardinale]|uniref:Nitrogen assimilation transcription factor nirA n=1 Tax=Seiridium cardinale TaxID=138064 RepID=A0ABR2Y8A9_9PEZI